MGDKFRINKIKPIVRKTLGDNKKIATQRAKLSDVKPDTFEHAKNSDDMGTMKFKTQKKVVFLGFYTYIIMYR